MKLLIDKKEIQIDKADSFKQRFLGLMFQKKVTSGMLFPHCSAIHTFGMRTEIDVIGLNKQNEVIFHKINVSKNKILFLPKGIKKTSVLELPKSTSSSIQIGQILSFIP